LEKVFEMTPNKTVDAQKALEELLRISTELYMAAEMQLYDPKQYRKWGKAVVYQRQILLEAALQTAAASDDPLWNVKSWLSDVPPLDDYDNVDAKLEWLIKRAGFTNACSGDHFAEIDYLDNEGWCVFKNIGDNAVNFICSCGDEQTAKSISDSLNRKTAAASKPNPVEEVDWLKRGATVHVNGEPCEVLRISEDSGVLLSRFGWKCRTLIDEHKAAASEVGDIDLDQLLYRTDELGKWMSAALDDPKVCAEMKADIQSWFKAQEPYQALARTEKPAEVNTQLLEALKDEEIERVAVAIWHRFAPDHHEEWEDEPEKEIYLGAACDALSTLSRKPVEDAPVKAQLLEALKRITTEAKLDGLSERAGWDVWINQAEAAIAAVEGEKQK
jgi:hypothetical protein